MPLLKVSNLDTSSVYSSLESARIRPVVEALEDVDVNVGQANALRSSFCKSAIKQTNEVFSVKAKQPTVDSESLRKVVQAEDDFD
jgi:hypothetical protein